MRSDTGLGYLDVVVALEVHRDLARPEMVVLAQIEDLADDVDMGGVGAMARSPGQITQTIDAELAVAAQPGVVGRPTNPVIAARHRDVAGHFLGVLDDR